MNTAPESISAVDAPQRPPRRDCGQSGRPRRAPWTPEQTAYLLEHYPTDGLAATAAALGMTTHAVNQRRHRLGLPARAEMAPRVSWTPENERLLRQLYGIVPTAELCRKFGCTDDAIRRQAQRLGLVIGEQAARQLDQAERKAEKAATLLAWKMDILSPSQAAAALHVPATRLPRLSLEVAMWAARSIERERTA